MRAGKLRSIGISNYYTQAQVDEVLSFAVIPPAVIQNENHLYYQGSSLRDYVAQYGIVMESWYPFGGRGHTQESFSNETVMELAEKYGKTPAQIILRWQLQSGFIAIPGSSNPDHIAENYDIFDFSLSGEDMLVHSSIIIVLLSQTQRALTVRWESFVFEYADMVRSSVSSPVFQNNDSLSRLNTLLLLFIQCP